MKQTKHTARSPDKKAIFFDVNQTLVRQQKSFQQCFCELWNEYAARWLQEDIPSGEVVWAKYISHWQLHRKPRMSAAALEELQLGCMAKAMGELAVPASVRMIGSLLTEARERQTASRTVAPKTDAALRLLAPVYQLAIISNSPREEVVYSLSRFGLDAYFPSDRIFTPVRLSDKKPASALFRSTLEALKLSPRQAVMVGNSWKHDIVGAVRAGLDAVWLQPSSEPDGAKKISRQKLGKRKVYLIHKLDQLTELFRV